MNKQLWIKIIGATFLFTSFSHVMAYYEETQNKLEEGSQVAQKTVATKAVKIVELIYEELKSEALSTDDALKKVYGLFQSAMKEKDFVTAEVYAEQSYKLFKDIHGEDHIQTGTLMLNYVKIFISNQSRQKQQNHNIHMAIPLLEEVIRIYELKYGDESVKLIDPIMQLGSVYRSSHVQNNIELSLKHYQRALKITEVSDESSPLIIADISLEIGITLTRSSKLKKSKSHFQKSHDIYLQELPENDLKIAKSALWLAKVNNALGSKKKAAKLFLNVLDTYNKAELSLTDERVQIVNANLVNVYEELGERDKATIYSQAIGKVRPWDENKEQTPIFLTQPLWSKLALQNGIEATVKINFIIDEQGYVKEPEISSINVNDPKTGSSKIKRQVSKMFKKQSLIAVKKWRFAPKFVAGQPVEAPTKYTLEFKLRK